MEVTRGGSDASTLLNHQLSRPCPPRQTAPRVNDRSNRRARPAAALLTLAWTRHHQPVPPLPTNRPRTTTHVVYCHGALFRPREVSAAAAPSPLRLPPPRVIATEPQLIPLPPLPPPLRCWPAPRPTHVHLDVRTHDRTHSTRAHQHAARRSGRASTSTYARERTHARAHTHATPPSRLCRNPPTRVQRAHTAPTRPPPRRHPPRRRRPATDTRRR